MLRNLIILPDGTEVSSGTSFSIKSSKLTECVNSGEELTIGTAQANMLEATLYDTGAKLSLTTGDEVTLYKVDEDGTRTKKGIFVLEKPTRPTANTLKLTAYDRMIKLDVDLTAWVNNLTGWPYTALTFASMVCEQCGLTFVTAPAPNSNFLVYQFKKTGMTGRKIMQWLAEICCRFCRANADGNIEFGWYTPSNVTIQPTGNRYYFSGGLTYETYTVAPIEAVQIRLAESASGALWPSVDSGLNSYIITGNAILNARITEDLKPYLEVIQNALSGVTYTPCKVSIPACLDVNVGNTVDIVDKNGNSITAYVMTKTTSGQRDTLECTGSARRTSSTAVNNPTAEQDNSTKSISAVAVLYYLSTSSAVLNGGEWSVVAPTWENGKYMWSKTVTTYSDGTSSESDPACITGAKGSTGADGKSVRSISQKTKTSTYETIQSWVGLTNDTWKDITLGEYNVGDTCFIAINVSDRNNEVGYMRCEIVSYSGTVLTTNNIDFMMGATGSPGEDGVGVSNIITQFYLSTSKTTQTNGSWVTSMPTWSKGKYLWTRSKITYTDGTIVYTSAQCDSSWEAVEDLNDALDQEEVFKRLTNNGALQGLFMEDGKMYINAEYIRALEKLFAKDITMTGKFTCTIDTYLPPTYDDVIYTAFSAVFPDKYPLPPEYDFDLNGDGVFTADDAIMAQEVYLGNKTMASCPGAQKTSATICIDMSNPQRAIYIYGVNMWGTQVESYISIDANNSSFASRDMLKRMLDFKPSNSNTLFRATTSGTQYLNPPFSIDEEYQTYEQYKGSAVTKKLDSSTGRMLWKTSGDWQTYAKMMGAFPSFQRILTSADDMDSITDDGIYVYSTASVPANAPFANAAVVMVFGADSTTTQKVQIGIRYGEGGHFKFRALYSSSWHAWSEIATTDETGYELLWENASKTSSFAAQTIDLDTTGYDHLLVVCAYNTSAAHGQASIPVWIRKQGAGVTYATLDAEYCDNNGVITKPYRRMQIPYTRATVIFTGGFLDGVASDNYLIPYYIYGVKGVMNP